jgi:hypothetical protein
MKLAIDKDRAGLKQAMETKDSKAMLKALNFGQEEFVELTKQRILASQRWQAKFGDKKEMLMNLRSKYGKGSSTECTLCNQSDFVKNIDVTLDKMHSVNLPPTVSELQKMAASKQNVNLQTCFWVWEWAQLVLGEAICLGAGVVCLGADIAALILSGGALAPAEVAMVILCGVITAGCMTAIYCWACHECH